jgi:hypothetical protein
MACLTTAEEVLEIMKGCTLTDAQIHPFINAAHILMDRVFEYDTTTTTDQKAELEKWLSAHIIFSVYGSGGSIGGSGAVKREKVGDAEIEYATTTFGKGLDSSPYGMMLKVLDTTGLLANAGKRAASIYAVKSFE